MDKSEKRFSKKLKDLECQDLVNLLEKWDMQEFIDFIKEKDVDGRKLLDITEGIVKLWRPKINAQKFIDFIQEIKLQPQKFLDDDNTNNNKKVDEIAPIECQYQVVSRKKSKEESTTINIEELLKRIVPAKSFLYRHQQKKIDRPTYLPMNPASPKKNRRLFRLSSYEYPFFDIRSRFKQRNPSERGYYSMKRNSNYCPNDENKKAEERAKYISLPTTEELSEKYADDHFYEDLCYNEIENKEAKAIAKPTPNQVKPCMGKIQELFQSFKIPFLKRTEVLDTKEELKHVETKHDVHIYENSDSVANMYDSIHVDARYIEASQKNSANLQVEDYLEPVQVNKDYVNVLYKQKDDSILGYIVSLIESRFGMRRETNDFIPSEVSEEDTKHSSSEWSEEKRGRGMVDRPLPIPVENEPYYMKIDRTEAENLLNGQPDGMFVLRPSSQTNHAYTLSVSCSGTVHNVGVRRKQDGRLALGFNRRGQRTFTSVTSLLRHHSRRRLLLVADGTVIGATVLKDTPQYYQTPSNLPVPLSNLSGSSSVST